MGSRRRHIFFFLFLSLLLVPVLLFGEERVEESKPSVVVIASAEVGIGPIEEDLFLHLTPRLSILAPTRALLCEVEDCSTFFEAALQVPVRLRLVDNEPFQESRLREEDWIEVSDFFRLIRRLSYGSRSTPLHLRVGELGPAQLGNASIVNGYYNVVTTDHYRLGFQGGLQKELFSLELLSNHLLRPNLWAFRGELRHPIFFDPQSNWKRFSMGASAVTDLEAPIRLEANDEGRTLAGPDLFPDIAETSPTFIVGIDLRWHLLRNQRTTLTPYVDVNHHLELGTGAHAGFYWSRSIESIAEISTKLEYRLLTGRYLPDYIDPLYEITRYQYPAQTPGLAAPKLEIARTMSPATRHGGYGEIQARLLRLLVLSLAYSDAEGPSNADLRARASLELNETARIGLFYYKFATSSEEESLFEKIADLFRPEGALLALEARQALWGPIYTHGQYGQQWRLSDEGQFTSLHLWNVGIGAAFSF